MIATSFRPEELALLALPRVRVADVECTCGPGITEDVRDMIEVALCTVDRDVPVTDERAITQMVRPTRSAVTPFCTTLTGITPAQVAGAPTFDVAAPAIASAVAASGAEAWMS